MAYVDEEKTYTVEGYKKHDYFRNYIIIEEQDRFIGYMAFAQDWKNFFQ